MAKRHFLTSPSLTFGPTTSVKKINDNSFDVDIINHEGVLFFEKELKEKNYDYIVIDESTVIKSHQGKIFKALCRIAENTKYKRVLSGTPSPQGPQDLWSQFFFLDNGLTLGTNYREFLEENFDIIDFGSGSTYRGSKPVIRVHGKNGQIGTIEAINERLKNRVFRCKLRECVDLPPLVERKLDVYLPDDLRKHYDKMKEDLFVELKDRTIEANIDLAKIGKLRQIASGFIIDSQTEDKKVIRLSKNNPKLEALKEWISELPEDEKVVIFATYKEEIKLLLKEFGKEAVSIYGDTSANAKLDNQRAFVNDPNVRFIICQPSSAAYGVNKLTVARYLLFYSIDYRADTVYQAIKRIERTGQTRSMVVRYLIAKDTVDEIMFRAIKNKDKIQQKTIDVEIVNEFLKS
jgi:SNF2 family DNA or RNA helicase